MIRAIAIDDRQSHLNTLVDLLAAHCADTIHLMGTGQSVKEGVAIIEKLRPELVFLDVELHNQTAFDLLAELKGIDFDIIFTTVNPEYAVQAIELNAVGYLVKPIESAGLKAAIEKATRKKAIEQRNAELEKMITAWTHPNSAYRTVPVPTSNGLAILSSADITRCESHGSYTWVYTKNANDTQQEDTYVVAKTLEKYEQMLSQHNFFRVHNSHLINLSFVKIYNSNGGFITMANGKKIEVSTRRKNAFLKRLNGE